MPGEVRSLFLHESDPGEVRKRRSQRLTSLDEGARPSMFEAHGALIREKAIAFGLPLISSRPFETLEARTPAAIAGPERLLS